VASPLHTRNQLGLLGSLLQGGGGQGHHELGVLGCGWETLGSSSPCHSAGTSADQRLQPA